MLRLAGNLLRGVQRFASICSKTASLNSNFPNHGSHSGDIIKNVVFKSHHRNMNILSATHLWKNETPCLAKNLTNYKEFLAPKVVQNTIEQKRGITKYSLRSGKRRSNKAVLKRFYRLNWGMWIRTRAGRHRRHWLKTGGRKIRSRWHVMTTSAQSHLLDKMTTNFWKRPKYYIDDPYEPYHSREEFHLTRRKPRPLD